MLILLTYAKYSLLAVIELNWISKHNCSLPTIIDSKFSTGNKLEIVSVGDSFVIEILKPFGFSLHRLCLQMEEFCSPALGLVNCNVFIVLSF